MKLPLSLFADHQVALCDYPEVPAVERWIARRIEPVRIAVDQLTFATFDRDLDADWWLDIAQDIQRNVKYATQKGTMSDGELAFFIMYDIHQWWFIDYKAEPKLPLHYKGIR